MNLPLKLFVGIGIATGVLALGSSMPARSDVARQVQTFQTAAGPVRITPIYHASVLLQAGGKNIYVDPVRPGNFDGLPQADLILITHDHGDHMDPVTISKLSKPDTQIIRPARHHL